MKYRSGLLALLLAVSATLVFAQTYESSISEPRQPSVVGPLIEPFHIQRRAVAPTRLADSPRMQSLVRGGNLYLSAQDVIALVLENNVDIAIQRYGIPLAREVQRRAEGGGFLRAVGTPIIAGPTSVSLAGVTVASVALGEGGGVSSGGGIITQTLPNPPNLDPTISFYTQFTHATTPLSNTLLNQTTALINNYRQYQVQYQQSFLSGTSGSLTYSAMSSKVNSPTVIYNPATTGQLDLYITQQLLQGWGIAVNNRNIRVAKNNVKVSDLQLKRQVITTVSAALNLYWDLVSFNEDARIKEQALATAQKLLEDNQHQVRLGELASIEVTRAAAEVSSSKEDLLISQTNVAQQETILKNALSRSVAASPWLDAVHIVPLNRIEVPEKEDLRPTQQLIADALTRRPELEITRVNLASNQILTVGSKSALRPALQAFVDVNNAALAGPLSPIYNGVSGPPEPIFVGGYGSFLGQIFRRNFPNYSAGFSLNIPLRNRVAQADYVTDQLNLRQSELQLQRTINQIRVDVKNAVIGLQQARARYEAAVATRALAEQSLQAEQNRFKFGQGSIPQVVQAQRDLTSDQSAEIQAKANYTHAKIAFDEAIGQTLEVNGITIEEAESGRVPRESAIPADAPQAAR